jgi:cyanophycin synthetase
VKGGFISRMQEGTWLGHVAEHVALQLQQEAGHDLRRGKTRMVKGRPASTTSSTATPTRRWAWPPGSLAVALVNDLVQAQEDFDFAEELERFLRRAERTAFGPSTGAILEEAVSRDIPYIRLNSGSSSSSGRASTPSGSARR